MAKTIDDNYWLERAKVGHKRNWSETQKATKELEKIYKKASHELKRELAIWLQRYQELHELDGVAMKSIMNTKEAAEFRYTVKGYMDRINELGEDSPHAKNLLREFDIMSGKIRYQRYEELDAQIKLQALELTSKTNAMVQQHLTGIYKENYYREIFEVQKGINLGTAFNLIDDDHVKRILSTPWNNKHFSSRLWGKVDDMSFNLRKVITGGIIQGKDFRNMSLDLQRATNSDYFKARRVLETETTFALERSRTEAWKELGIENYEFVATLDNVTSEECQRLDGKIFRLKDKQEGINAPPMHCFCRSVTVPAVLKAEDAKRIAKDENGKNYYVPADMNYEEWKEKYKVTNYEPEKREKNRANDEKQYENYKNVVGLKNLPSSFAKFQNLKYNNPEEWELMKKYKGSIEARRLTPFSTFEDVKKISKEVEKELVGKITSNGVLISGYEYHFIERALGTYKRNGVELKEIKNALTNFEPRPVKNNNGKPSLNFVSDSCNVSLNPETTKLIQCNPISRGR